MDNEIVDGQSAEIHKVEPNQMQLAKDESPFSMMIELLSNGAEIDTSTMKELFEIRKDYEAEEARKAFHVAMSAFKENPPTIFKDKKVGFNTSSGRTEYNHASLGNVTSTINKALSLHGLSALWKTDTLDNGAIKVTCVITHALGHSESTSLPGMPDTSGKKNPIQAVGSTVSYLQRYTILSLTGLATDEMDDDGNGALDQNPPPPAAQPATREEKGIIKAIIGKLPPKDGSGFNEIRITALCLEGDRKYLKPEYVDRMSEWVMKFGDADLYIPIDPDDFGQSNETEVQFENQP